MVLEGPPAGKTDPAPIFTGVRTRRYAYVEWTFTGERELYDLRRDPYELRNLAGTPAARPVQARLAGTLKRLREDNATLDARVVERAIELGELRERLAAVEARATR